MTITFDNGTKGDGDQIIKYNEIPITIIDIAKLLLKLWENEDKIYPPSKGYQGAQMSKNFLNEVFENRDITDDMLFRYKLGKYRPQLRKYKT